MANPLAAKKDETDDFGQPTTTSGGGPETGGNTGNLSALAPPPVQQNANPPDMAKIAKLNQGVNFNPIMDFVKGQGTQARNAITGEDTNFNTALAKSYNPFDQDEVNTLEGALSGNGSTQDAMGVMNRSYTGPTQVNRSTYDPLTQKYVASANQTANPNGINALIGTLRPDLTPGQKNYDSMIFGKNPAYQAQSRALVNDASQVQDQGNALFAGSGNSVADQQQAVANSNIQARQYVQSQRDALNAALNKQIADASNHDYRLQSSLPDYQQKTDWGIQGFGPALGIPDLGFDPSGYQNTTITGQQDPDFKRVVNPQQFLNFQPGTTATRTNVANPNQIARYNAAQGLLGETDRLSNTTPYRAASLGLDSKALQAALQQAMTDRSAADNAWFAAHQPKPVVEEEKPWEWQAPFESQFN